MLLQAGRVLECAVLAGDDLARAYDLSSLRFVASVGEPLNPEAVYRALRAKQGRPLED